MSLHDQPGYRRNLSARNDQVRGAYGLESGDRDGWQVVALARVRQSAALRKRRRRSITVAGCGSLPLGCDRKRGEIVSWAEAVEADAE